MAESSTKPLAESPDAKLIKSADGRHYGKWIDQVDEIEIVDCETCGFAHVLPLPTPGELEEVYRQEYYSDEKPTYLEHAREDEAWSKLAYQDRLSLFQLHLPAGRRSLLDIGSGPGLFLKAAHDAGWQVRGIEPSQQAAQHTRDMGLDVVNDFFNVETASKLGTFDVVNMINMLEHVPAPLELIKCAVDIVTPGGLLSVTVPNDFSGLQIAARSNKNLPPWWISPKHHLNYFDFESLARIGERFGLIELTRTTSFPMEMFLLMGDDYTQDAALGRACHNRRKSFDLALESTEFPHLRRAFYNSLANVGIGREATVIFKKPGDAC